MTQPNRLLLTGIGFGSVLALAACVPPSPEPTPAPAPSPVAIPAPTPAPQPVTRVTNWQDAAITAGDWTYVREPGETLAIFGQDRTRSGVELIVRCDLATRRIGIARAGNPGGAVQMLVRTETQERTLTANPVDGAAPLVAAELAASDDLLDAMAFSKGRFAIEAAGIAPLYAPAWPEITRVIEDCRN